MTSRSPPLSRIIPIFLWLKIKEISYVAAWTILVIVGIVLFYLLSGFIGYSVGSKYCESMTYFQGFGNNECYVDMVFQGTFITIIGALLLYMVGTLIWMCASLIADWLRSNWQQATRIAKAREKGR